MADFLDFLLASPVKSPVPLEITATTTLEDVIAATILPETTSQTPPTTNHSDSDDEALAAEILAEATTQEPEPVTETRLADSLFDLLGPPPAEKPLYNELTLLLKDELKLQTKPDTLLKLLRPKMSVFAREQQLQQQFTKLETTNSTEITQLSSFFKYQSAVIETERYQALHQAATKPHLRDSINSYYDNQLHKAIDRVELSVRNLQQTVTQSTSQSSTRRTTLRSRPVLSQKAVQLMEEWYHGNLHHPYPDPATILDISMQGNIREAQVKKWFANKRSRSHNTNSRTVITSRKMSHRYSRTSYYQPY